MLSIDSEATGGLEDWRDSVFLVSPWRQQCETHHCEEEEHNTHTHTNTGACFNSSLTIY